MASTVVVVAVLTILLQVSLQGWIVGAVTTHVVGGSTGWSLPLPNNTFYADWASSQTFVVGDILQFNFETGRHDVVAVTKSGYDACDSNGQITSPLTNGPASIPLSSAGEHYYLCGITGHCSAGQKLAVNVVSSPGSGSGADAPSPSSGGSSPPSGSAGALVAPPSLVAVGLSLLLVNIINALR